MTFQLLFLNLATFGRMQAGSAIIADQEMLMHIVYNYTVLWNYLNSLPKKDII